MEIRSRHQVFVMAKPYPHWYKTTQNDVIAVIQPGQRLQVCGFSPAKDFAVYEVKLSDGRTGYVEFDSASIEEISPNSKSDRSPDSR